MGPVAPVTLMIADFNNHTGDPVFSGTLESTLKLALEGASFISAYDRTRMKDLGLKVISGALDEAKAQEIAAAGFERGGFRLARPARRRVPAFGASGADGHRQGDRDGGRDGAEQGPGSFRRDQVGDRGPQGAGRFHVGIGLTLSMETLTAASLEAVHEYAAGLDALSAGKFEETQKYSLAGRGPDPNFGMAYTVMASAARNLGRQQDAEKTSKRRSTSTG